MGLFRLRKQDVVVVLQLLVMTVLSEKSVYSTSTQNSKPGCPTTCGSVTIPYPFGISEGCYLDESFLMTCEANNSTLFLGRSNISVVDISVDDAELRISTSVFSYCYNQSGVLVNSNDSSFDLPHFYISSAKNKAYGVGCDTVGVISGWDYQNNNYTTGCVSLCDKTSTMVNATCLGTGCCQSPIPQGLSGSALLSFPAINKTEVREFDPCGYAFLAEEGAYSFSTTHFLYFPYKTFPVVIEWAMENKTCHQASNNLTTYACKSQFSQCLQSINGIGYRCKCSNGFLGNPYLTDGCQEINECVELAPCDEHARCDNYPGGFKCSCLDGYVGDGKIVKLNGTGCQLKFNTNSGQYTILVTTLSVSVSVLVLLVGGLYVYWHMKKRNLMKLRQKFFQQNGGMLLQQQIAEHGKSSTQTPKIFTVEELKKATDNFDERRVLGKGGHGTVYKGVLPNNTVVAIKKSIICDQSQIEEFINEVIILSQINHRNVVKLLGCCLETQVPLLVYECITDGTLFHHLHDQTLSSKLSWRMRLRIAAETASALAYLHSAASIPIIHRDVKTTNILLDCYLTAKVSDFGASRLVPLDQTQITTLVQGTFGYLDPEYLHTSRLTEKSDVYSFGVVLAELLTSKKAVSFERPEGQRNLSIYFESCKKQSELLQIIDTHIMSEENVKQIMEVANITKRCLRVKGEDRPMMKEVAMELEGLRVMESRALEGGSGYNVDAQETEYLLNEASPVANNIDGIERNVRDASINEISISWDSGR